jgi:hypothetical protein
VPIKIPLFQDNHVSPFHRLTSPPIQANQFSMRKDVVPHGLFLRGFVGIFQIRMPVIQSEKFVEMAMRANRRAWTLQTRSRRPNMMLI